MGCNIHLFTEKKVKEQWVCTDKLVKHSLGEEFDPDDDEPEYRLDSVYDNRNYRLFAILADVRNDYNIKPITRYPQGLPFDVSPEVQAEADRWSKGGYVFSHSYLTLKELEEFDWAGQAFESHGWVSASGYQQFKAKARGGRPMSCCSWMDGPNVKRVKRAEMDRLIAAGGNLDGIYTKVKWTQTYEQVSLDFIEVVLPHLRNIAAGNSKASRIVFWFDN